uniref:Uncharacterized protein n=1 Tax=Escherichia coli TaxID=562 RepID=A0A2S1JKK6_ECOLX|nr:hypothetical protein [Escherichia coli]WKV18534.1 hypothetical protein [Escherichia coli]
MNKTKGCLIANFATVPASLIPDSGPSAALRIVAASARIPVSPSAVQPADRHAACTGGARAAGL